VDVVPIKFHQFMFGKMAAVAMEMAKMLKNWKTQKWL
jgi:hypothetical protein